MNFEDFHSEMFSSCHEVIKTLHRKQNYYLPCLRSQHVHETGVSQASVDKLLSCHQTIRVNIHLAEDCVGSLVR